MFANSAGQGEEKYNTDCLSVSGAQSGGWWFAAPASQERSDCLDLRGRTSPTSSSRTLQSPPVHLSLFPDLPGGPTDSHCTATGAS